MKVYLVRHGEALSPEINPEKPLSPQGRGEIERIAKFLARKSFPLFTILHSQKLRAKETAEILGEHLEPELALEEHFHLGPNDEIEPILQRIEAEERPMMVVGHLPFLEKLLAQLIVADEHPHLVEFRQGTTVCLEKTDGGWTIDWVVGLDQV